MTTKNVFHIWDYVIFIITIVVSLGIGLYYALSGGRQRTISEYLVGNRKMSVLPVAISLMVSFESSIMMLGIPAEVYNFGVQYIIGTFGWFVANSLALQLLVPLVHCLKITSVFEYLELRFKSRAVRLLATVLGMISYILYMGVVLFGPAVALEAVTGFPLYSSIIVVAAAAIIYTAIGGIKAVIWTDVFQCIVMFAGMFSILIKGTMEVGGVAKTWKIAAEKGRLNFFNFDPNPMTRHTFWNLFFGTILRGFSLALNQSSVQRISSTPRLKDARRVMMIVTPAFCLTSSLAIFEGVVAYSYFDNLRCDPLKSKQIRDLNQVIPHMVMSMFENYPGMAGLFLASLFSASLSTLSSGLSSLSANMMQDFVKPYTKPMSEFKATLIAKISVVFFGLIAIAVAYLVSIIGGTLTQISNMIMSTVGAPLSGVFLLGIFCPWANAKGALISCIGGVAVLLWIVAGMNFSPGAKRWTPLPSAPTDMCFTDNIANSSWTYNTTESHQNITMWSTSTMETLRSATEPEGLDKLYSMSYQLIAVVGILFVIIFGSLISFLTGHVKPKDSNPMHIVSVIEELFFFLPESIRKPLRFGYTYINRNELKEKELELESKLFQTPSGDTLLVELWGDSNIRSSLRVDNSDVDDKYQNNSEMEMKTFTYPRLNNETEKNCNVMVVYVK